MITFSRLGKKGNLGNQLFQIASTIGIAKKNNQDYCFPFWEYSIYFQSDLKTCTANYDYSVVNERKFNYYNVALPATNCDLNGWFQSEKYFLNANCKDVFKFQVDFENKILEKHKHLFSKKTILISVRRGDFVNNPNYFQLSYKFYLTALHSHFDNLTDYNVIFTSDSISYCKNHFSFLPNVFFLENLNPIEQLCLGSKFDNYIISNSTFSWWLAWLGEKLDTKIIRPVKIFDGEYSIKYDESDYFPKRWIIHHDSKIKVSNKFWKITFYGNLCILKDNLNYVFKVNKKLLKTLVKRIILKD